MKLINIEVDIGNGVIFDCIKEINGVWIGTDLFNIEKFKPSERARVKQKLIEDLKWIVKDINKSAEDIHIQAPHFALDCYFNIFNRSFYCIVDKRKEIVYLRIPMIFVEGYFTIDVDANEYNYLLYHELMHAKDCLEGRFPSCGIIIPGENSDLDLITSFWHFSIEGRLEKSGLPHLNQEEAITAEYEWLECFEPKLSKKLTRELLGEYCRNFWGKEVTFNELLSVISTLKKEDFR